MGFTKKELRVYEITAEMEKQQEIQRSNPPSSKAWQEASERLHKLGAELIGKPVKDARGRR